MDDKNSYMNDETRKKIACSAMVEGGCEMVFEGNYKEVAEASMKHGAETHPQMKAEWENMSEEQKKEFMDKYHQAWENAEVIE